MPFDYPQLAIDAIDYSSFVALATAEQYLAVDTSAIGWAAGDATDRSKWLVQATRILDRQSWRGDKTEAANELAWPRTGISGIDSATIPIQIEQATAELASQMANGYDAAGQATTAEGIRRQKAGSVEQEFFAPGTAGVAVGQRFPLPVWELIAPFLEGGGAGELFGGSISTGTCGVRPLAREDYSAGPYIGNTGADRTWD